MSKEQKIKELEAEIARLREALKPFAELGRKAHKPTPLFAAAAKAYYGPQFELEYDA